jgi:anti-sigma B factor antagonist
MNIIVELLNNVANLKVEGRLDTITAPELDKRINELDVKGIVLDFANLEYISSAGLRVLLSTHKKFVKLNGMKVTNVKSEVMEIFEMTGFADILDIE